MAAIVLAAGSSTRFGSFKQLTQVNGTPMLEKTLDGVRQSDVSSIVLVLGFRAEDIIRRLNLERLRVVVNRDYARGMSASIAAGLRALPVDVDGVLMVLADQPFVRSGTYNKLIAAYRHGQSIAVVPVYEGKRGNPALLDLSLRPRMEALRGDTGCRAIIESLENVLELDVDDPGVLVDVDEQRQLKRGLEPPGGVSSA